MDTKDGVRYVQLKLSEMEITGLWPIPALMIALSVFWYFLRRIISEAKRLNNEHDQVFADEDELRNIKYMLPEESFQFEES